MEKKVLIKYARELRQNSTDAEKLLWGYLRNRKFENLKFRRQEPIGKYIVDFLCYEKKLIIELDGGQHNLFKEKDLIRDEWMNKQGYKVIRFWNNEVLNNIDGVLISIKENCK